MDWADDVSYATHDFEDYVRTGLISFSNLRKESTQFLVKAASDLSNQYGRSFDLRKFGLSWEALLELFPKEPYTGCREDRGALREFTSGRVKEFVEAVKVHEGPPFVTINVDMQYRVEALKRLTWFYVIDSPPLAAAQDGQRRIVEKLFQQLYEWLEKEVTTRMPRQLVELGEQQRRDSEGIVGVSEAGREDYVRARAVADYICTLTETQARDMHERVSGISRASVFGAWFD